MADPIFPFPPMPRGRFCSNCCPECAVIVGDPEGECCDSLSDGSKECYNPNACFECKTIDENTRRVVNTCTDPEQRYVHEGKTSCCFGTCFDNRCYRCEGTNRQNARILPTFNQAPGSPGFGQIEICCGGVKRSIDPNIKDSCKECISVPQTATVNGKTVSYNQELISENFCGGKNPDCCYGTCWNSNNTSCNECDDTTKRVAQQCPPNPDSPLTACCGGECWLGPDRDKCQECIDDQLVPKSNCNCCSNQVRIRRIDGSFAYITNNKTCCPPEGNPSQTTCCETTGTCYNPECERCY